MLQPPRLPKHNPSDPTALLRQDVLRLADLQVLDGGGVGVVDLLDEVHEAREREEAGVDLGGEAGEEVAAVGFRVLVIRSRRLRCL